MRAKALYSLEQCEGLELTSPLISPPLSLTILWRISCTDCRTNRTTVWNRRQQPTVTLPFHPHCFLRRLVISPRGETGFCLNASLLSNPFCDVISPLASHALPMVSLSLPPTSPGSISVLCIYTYAAHSLGVAKLLKRDLSCFFR